MATLPILHSLLSPQVQPISTVEMHTTGEPTRIVYAGFPQLQGATLLQKMVDAQTNHDHIRGRLMLEPRGHKEMFGALLVKNTELIDKGEADIGVLFMHNHGWATMCGHATIGLGRFLVDSAAEDGSNCLPQSKFQLDEENMTTRVKLHCPCGIIRVTVPVKKGPEGQLQSDPERPVSFVNANSFATGIDVEISLPTKYRWPELGGKTSVTVDFCFGGAFYCVIGVEELGFSGGLNISFLDAFSRATAMLKAAIVADVRLRRYFQHGENENLGSLYGVIVTDDKQGRAADGAVGGETGLCFFAAQQVDRSPCGSGAAARRALAHAKGMRPPETRWTYHSLVSNAHNQGGFTTQIIGDAPADGVRVQVEGRAFYIGFSTFVVEGADGISNAGFIM